MATGSPPKPKILLVDPQFGEMGGGVTVRHWMIEALSRDYDLTVYCWRTEDYEAQQKIYGTRFRSDAVRQMRPGVVWRALGETLHWIDNDTFGVQRWAILLRVLRRVARGYDLVVTNADETDSGAYRSLQYVHYPYLGRIIEHVGDRLRIKPEAARRPWRLISGFDPERVRRNRTLVNSAWTADRFRDVYAAEAEVLYPPVPGPFPAVPWDQRRNAIAAIGRLTGDKRFDVIIDIARDVRRRVPDTELHIFGVASKFQPEDRTPDTLRALAQENEWIFLHEDLPRDEMLRRVGACRIGLHAKIDEHFGIAVAELMRAGCATVVHDSGGQVEIVGRDPALTYRTPEDAAERIVPLLLDDALREAVMDRLSSRRDLFSEDRFCAELRRIVAEMLTVPATCS